MSDNKTTDTISMHFRHSTTVDELVNKLRAHYVWNEKDDLPEWIAEPLKDFPLLASYAQTLLQTLRSIPTSFGDQEATEYDLLVNCMITDQIMTSLREFELHYRAAHPVGFLGFNNIEKFGAVKIQLVHICGGLLESRMGKRKPFLLKFHKVF